MPPPDSSAWGEQLFDLGRELRFHLPEQPAAQIGWQLRQQVGGVVRSHLRHDGGQHPLVHGACGGERRRRVRRCQGLGRQAGAQQAEDSGPLLVLEASHEVGEVRGVVGC